jgi:hypothetical protein
MLRMLSRSNKRVSGIIPNEQGRAYTSPGIRLDSATYMQDSAKIATELERRYPEPSLYLDSPLLPKAYAAVSDSMDMVRPIMLPKVFSNILNERSADYISRTRAEALSRAREKYTEEADVEEAWKKAYEPLRILGALIMENGGPFVMGKTRKLCSHNSSHTRGL